LKLTNLRAIRDNEWVMLKDCDIVVANKTVQEDGTTVGDIEFAKQGAPVIVFTKVTDPDHIAAMAIAAKEHVLALIKRLKQRSRPKKKRLRG
jgi:nucleoside 2-deoxyribosyltransferase